MKLKENFENILEDYSIVKGDRIWFKNSRGVKIFKDVTRTDDRYAYYRDGSVEKKVDFQNATKVRKKGN